jgi:20S proteasome subunit beta 7
VNPKLNVTLVGGMEEKDGEKIPYLGEVDMYGTYLEDDFLVGGYAHYFCKVLLTHKWRPDLEELEAIQLLEECMRVLFYRDTRASDR